MSNPAASEPCTAPPQSMTRAPATFDADTRSRAAFRSISSATACARSLSVMVATPESDHEVVEFPRA